jgi:hypothetical protein
MTEGKPVWEAQGRFCDVSGVARVSYFWYALFNRFLYFIVAPMNTASFLQLRRPLLSLLILLPGSTKTIRIDFITAIGIITVIIIVTITTSPIFSLLSFLSLLLVLMILAITK